ncbi:MAG: alpha/beta hydrolase [Gammaproteobacteria bacterium]
MTFASFRVKGLVSICVALAVALAVAGAAERPVPSSVSPEAQAYLGRLQPRPQVALDYGDPAVMERLRNGLGRMFLASARRIRDDYTLEAIDAGGVPAVWVHTPVPVRKGKVLLYIHGGGFILGSATTDLALPLRIGPATGLPVLSVDYRLAPEHPYPAAANDVLAAYRWLLKQGYKARDIGVLGDSAGGDLALVLVLAARDAGLPAPAAIAVLSPVTDMTGSGDTRVTLGTADPILSGDAPARWSAYLGGQEPGDPKVSPVFADLRGFPPLLVQVGTREVLLSDSVRLARKARTDGVDVTLDVWEGMWHVWQGNPDVPESKAAANEIAAFFRRHVLGQRHVPANVGRESEARLPADAPA